MPGTVWECCAKTHKLKLQRIQNKILRMVLNVPSWTRTLDVHELTGIKTLDEKVQIYCTKFRDKCANSEYNMIQNLV